jgi:hypothetical protein
MLRLQTHPNSGNKQKSDSSADFKAGRKTSGASPQFALFIWLTNQQYWHGTIGQHALRDRT